MGWRPNMTPAQRAKLNASRRRRYGLQRLMMGKTYKPTRPEENLTETGDLLYSSVTLVEKDGKLVVQPRHDPGKEAGSNLKLNLGGNHEATGLVRDRRPNRLSPDNSRQDGSHAEAHHAGQGIQAPQEADAAGSQEPKEE